MVPLMTKKITPRAAREAKGLKPADLAARVPCALSTVYAIEAQGRFPVQRALRSRYLKVLGVTELVVSK